MMHFAHIVLGTLSLAILPLTSAQRASTATIDILAYNDVYELLQDNVNGLSLGGPSRVVPLVASMRAKNPNSLVLFAGDTMSPSLWSSQFKGMQMTHAHNAIGTDFACLGNHEFDFGIEAFLNVSNATNFPWLNANCYENATGTLLRSTIPRAVKTLSDPKYGKIKIGFFGVMYDMKDSSKGLYWTDPIEAAKEQVKILRTQEKVDMVIALTHQDLADDNRMSKEVKGIDIIYGGHDHSSMLQTSFGTPYLKADFDFRSVWQSHIEYFKADPTKKLTTTFRMQHQATPIVQDMITDPALDTIIADYSAKIDKLFSVVIGSLCEPLDLQEKVVRTQDAPIGHIFADAQLKAYADKSVDVSLVNGGGIRTDKVYPEGNLTLGAVLSWSPFGNTIMMIETDGASMKKFITKEMLATCGDNVIQKNGMYVHPAGIKYTFTCTSANTGTITNIEWSNHPTRNGPVLDKDVFRLVMSDFLYKTEFSIISSVRSKIIVADTEAQRVDTSLDKYIQALPNASLCEKGEVRSTVSF